MQSRNIKQTSVKLPDVNVGVDKGSLRLQFSVRVSRKFYGKRQAYKGLGRSDTPENQNWAYNIARRIQTDIDYPDGELFDPSLAKYLDIKARTPNVLQLPNTKKIPLLKELWDEFSEWKLKTAQIGETTYKSLYNRTFRNYIKEFFDEPFNETTANKIIDKIISKKSSYSTATGIASALSSLCDWASSKDTGIIKDYFKEIKSNFTRPKKSIQLSELEDYKAYSVEERDLIINSFYNSRREPERKIAPLIEFLFLTGCRHGEVFALQWKDIKFQTGWIVFDESYSTEFKITGNTKTDVTRIFKMKGISRLINLLRQLYDDSKKPDDFVFTCDGKKQFQRYHLKSTWFKATWNRKGINHESLGVVTTLEKEGKLQYLKPYSTRHTFISIQANNGADLKLLADSCGNSVDVIIKHYLQPDKERVLLDI